MSQILRNAINKHEIEKLSIQNQIMALFLISCADKEVYDALGKTTNLRQYLKNLKGLKSCEVQYGAS